ncbi:family 10 glycosylhydrolase [Maribellus comscasis]|uniref:Family 10 glycosylhydrolase n=1 Tax=Maribellus comscasis TaxID=2681766 RepID=A0A6I6JTI2_9BACT|nr:family 10 glycosylhydrolase [Maribellus comscasis]QGY43457.1 family 10 glycosylhydrolase [Maribellus comscasis]
MKNKTIWFIVFITLVVITGCNKGETGKSGNEAIRAYNIDYNWGPGGAHGFAEPGLWADANPEELMDWYEDLGCNAVHSFGVSCNGYAWYKNGVVPEQPGLKYDFLTEMVKIGRRKNMKVFGYFCVGANNKWEEDHPDLCYGMNGQQIPFTKKYVDYLSSSIEDAIKKTDMDGIMLDWFYNPGGGRDPLPPLRWMECEQEMYEELMQQPFPGKDSITPEIELDFRRKAIDRAWQQIKTTTKRAKPDCIIWLTAYEVDSKEYEGSALLKEVDWLMNEAGDIKRTAAMRDLTGSETKLITCLANWNKQNPAEIVPAALKENVGLYGFTKPVIGPMMKPVDYYLSNPIDSLKEDERNIAVLARAFNDLPLNYVKKQ